MDRSKTIKELADKDVKNLFIKQGKHNGSQVGNYIILQSRIL